MEMNEIIRRAKRVLVAPADFFAEIHDESTLLLHWLYYLVISAVYALLTLLFSIPVVVLSSLVQGIADPTGGMFAAGTGILFLIGLHIGSFIIGLGLIFISAGLVHIFAMLLGSKQPYVQSFKMTCYGFTPLLFLAPFELLNAIPLIGGVFYFLAFLAVMAFSYYVMVNGGIQLHKFSAGRSVMAFVVLPIALFAAIGIIAVLIVILVAVGFVGSTSPAAIGL